jgi:molybdopterin molybdotransferase
MAALTAGGVTSVEVARRLVVRVLTSGSEVVAACERPRLGQVPDVNGPFLRSSVAALLGYESRSAPAVVPDDAQAMRGCLGDALEGADLVIVTGGVSVGDRDLVKPVLEEQLAVERLVWGVAQKPGKPTYVGRRAETWVLGLPGNPAAVAVSWYVLVRPLLLALQGARAPGPPRVPVRLVAATGRNRSRTSLRWCEERWRDGELWAEPLARTGSHMLSDLARSDVLAILPPGGEALPAGTLVEAVPLGRWPDRSE